VEGQQFHEGERLPHDDERPCEVCYCIKSARKCTVKKCAPVIRGCVPKMPAQHGSCCPTSYDCRRSIKYKRESRQENEEEAEEEEDTDTIDFFSLLFGSDDPKEGEGEGTTVTPQTTTTTAPPPFKALPSTTESSFFDFIRAGLEMIDANADKIDTHLNSIVPTTSSSTIPPHDDEVTERTTEKLFDTSTAKVKTSVTPDVNEMTRATESFPLKSTTVERTTPTPVTRRESSTMKISPSGMD
jgi:hypothetical protein